MLQKQNDVKHLRLALVSDIHHGLDQGTKLGSQAPHLLKSFSLFADIMQADAVLDLGDRINCHDRDSDLVHLQEVAGQMNGLLIPHFHLLGNHDVEHLTAEDHEECLGASMCSQVVELAGISLIIWQANTRNFFKGGPTFGNGDLAWLQNALENCKGPAIIATHVPLDSASMAGNYYFENNPRYATYADVADARKIIEDSGKVILCLAGHIHANTLSVINGIPYFSLHSLVESCSSFGVASATWGFVEISAQGISIEVLGKEPMVFTLKRSLDSLKQVAQERQVNPKPLAEGFIPLAPAKEIDLKGIENILFDMDGVFYEGNTALPGGAKMLSYLQETGRKYVAITNNSRYYPEELSLRLQAMGVNLAASDILTSGIVTARYLQQERPGAKVYVLGTDALCDALLRCDLQLVRHEQPDYVVLGWHEDFTVDTLRRAVRFLHNGAQLIATNGDPLIPLPDGPGPENGCLIAFLEKASEQQAKIIGKPHRILYQAGMTQLSAELDKTIMVGDTLTTDILGAKRSGLASVYLGHKTLTGVDPDIRCINLEELAQLFKEADSQ